MNQLLPPGLFRRMTISFFLVAALSVSVMAAIAISTILQNGVQQLERSLEDDAFSLSTILVGEVQDYNAGQAPSSIIQATIDQYLANRPEILYTAIDNQHRVIATNEFQATNDDFLKGVDYQTVLSGHEAEAPIKDSQGIRIFFVAVPITINGELLGALRLATPMANSLAGTYKTVWLILISSLLLMISVIMVGWLTARGLVAPINKLINVADKFSSGELNIRAELEGPREFVQLAEAFNQMAERQQNNMDNLRGFVYNASHELRTPLTAIRLNLDALQQGALNEPEVARRFLIQTQDEIDRLNRMVTDLLDLSRIEFNRDNIVFVALDLNQVVREAQQFWSVRARQAGLELRITLPAQSPLVRANEDQINQVISNLLDNAIKNTASGGWVEIAVFFEPGQNHARLEVRDNGRGIAPEHLAHVFERFYRVEKTTPQGSKVIGSGLGLSIARTIMEAHDGTIGANSVVGKGSTFWIELPAVVSRAHR